MRNEEEKDSILKPIYSSLTIEREVKTNVNTAVIVRIK
jgi:hypothetical protein